MSVEFRPVSAIPFRDIDERLEKYGIKVERSGDSTALTGRTGTLFATPEGDSTHFESICLSIRKTSWMQFKRSIGRDCR